ncbi:hypothetical protein JANAI61_37390 [Jannaschia sp. AI_61]|uniref:right-handed parallel beta-helix repeat-containing protein n=1 Tax=Jannaschia sp. AI_61 TaxID=2829796 RepID=UPI001BC6EFF5|nr:right-handed parallel beta-helix repeat-containing protein [Jannaschia sp. AI_61]GIT93281.1 hypothetical protein JANAI61_37390 [Jannaschia sp. AI_61]
MPATLTVASTSDLYDALAKATQGQTILLKGGDYGELTLTGQSGFDLTFPKGVTIASADPSDPAVFSGLKVRDTANLTFDGITFDYTFQADDPIWVRPFSIFESENITVRNSTFSGDLAQDLSEIDDGYGYGIGLTVRESALVTLENNEIFDFHRGFNITETNDVTVRGNDMHSIRMDGMTFAEVDGALIEGNHIHDFRGSEGSPDHRDMIQFWTKGTDAPSQDIVIRDNHLDIGEGSFTHSIFMRNDQVDRGLAGEEMFYQNILIEENVIVNGHVHGINIGETNGLTIRNNSVLHNDGGTVDGVDEQVEIPRIRVAESATDVTITQNAVAEIIGHTDQPDWSVGMNAFVQDQNPNTPGYYGDVFLTSSLVPVDGVHNPRALPGGMLDRLDAGAPATRDRGEAKVDYQVTPDANNGAHHVFEAFDSTDGDGTATYVWTFPDGTTAMGARVEHMFAQGGSHEVVLTTVWPDKSRDTQSFSVDVTGAKVLSYTADTGFLAHDSGDSISLDIESAADGLHLGAKGIAAKGDREYLMALENQDEVAISMTLRAHTAASEGEVVRLHGSFIVSVTSKGEIQVRMFDTNDDQIKLTTVGADLSDMAEHDVKIELRDGMLSISVDDKILAETEMAGDLALSDSHDLTFGNPWNKQNFDGVLSSFDISVDGSDFAAAPTKTTPVEAPLLLDDSAIVSFESRTTEAPSSDATDTPEALDTPTGRPEGIELGAVGVTARVERADLAEAFGTKDFSLSMALQANGEDSAGEVMRVHGSFIVKITEDGDVMLRVRSTDGENLRLETDGAGLTDMDPHDIDITLKDGQLSIAVDGDVLAKTEMTGGLGASGRHDLTIGNPWDQTNFDGVLADLTFSADGQPVVVAAQLEAPEIEVLSPAKEPSVETVDFAAHTAEDAPSHFEAMMVNGHADAYSTSL